jgi:hypothetical protein
MSASNEGPAIPLDEPAACHAVSHDEFPGECGACLPPPPPPTRRRLSSDDDGGAFHAEPPSEWEGHHALSQLAGRRELNHCEFCGPFYQPSAGQSICLPCVKPNNCWDHLTWCDPEIGTGGEIAGVYHPDFTVDCATADMNQTNLDDPCDAVEMCSNGQCEAHGGTNRRYAMELELETPCESSNPADCWQSASFQSDGRGLALELPPLRATCGAAEVEPRVQYFAAVDLSETLTTVDAPCDLIASPSTYGSGSRFWEHPSFNGGKPLTTVGSSDHVRSSQPYTLHLDPASSLLAEGRVLHVIANLVRRGRPRPALLPPPALRLAPGAARPCSPSCSTVHSRPGLFARYDVNNAGGTLFGRPMGAKRQEANARQSVCQQHALLPGLGPLNLRCATRD